MDFIVRVQTNRSAIPLPSGSLTKVGALWIPRKENLLLKHSGNVLAAVLMLEGQVLSQPKNKALKSSSTLKVLNL